MSLLLAAGHCRAADPVAAAPGDSDRQTQASNARCLGCHSEAGLKETPHPGLHVEGLANHLLSPEAYAASVHGDEGCKDCHGDAYETVPHVSLALWQTKGCPDCHKSAKRQNVPEFEDTLHFRNHPNDFNCASCHNPHTLQAAKTLGTGRKLAAQDNGLCLDCHASDQRYAAYSAKPRPDLIASHQWLPNRELHWQATRCIDCHTPARENGSTSHVILGKDKALRDCAACHNASSSLRTRLYRHFSDQGLEQAGFLNGAVLSEAYVVGATRNRWLDQASWIIAGLLLAGLALHAGLRLAAFVRRNRRK